MHLSSLELCFVQVWPSVQCAVCSVVLVVLVVSDPRHTLRILHIN